MTALTARRLLLASLFLAGCASFGEKPSDVEIARLHWYQDAPAFHFKTLEWNWIAGSGARQRLVNLCAMDARMVNEACTFRIREGGQCVVYSLYSEVAAQTYMLPNGQSLHAHELAHCGVGMPALGGWNHRELVVLR